MSRPSTKKNQVERRKKPRGSRSKTAKAAAPRAQSQLRAEEDSCRHCSKDLSGTEKALFVEEEIGRIFCSEACITGFFGPEIERLEKDYLRRATPNDLTPDERESLAHLRWITLQEPDEVWREKTLSGDFRYTLISEFQPGTRRIWCVCICLFLRGEPSFLYLAFPTRNAAMLNHYRKGEQVEWSKSDSKPKKVKATVPALEDTLPEVVESADADEELPMDLGDRLADAWTEDETFRAQVYNERNQTDIQPEEFALYQGCIEETLETPDEVWSLSPADSDMHVYHFIRQYVEENSTHWYVIVARETEDEEQIEILDAFPTRDSNLVDRYRRGSQEVGEVTEHRSVSRVVH